MTAVADDLGSVSTFLYREARLLDELELDAWLALFAPDAEYWMPASWNQADPLNHLSLYHETLDLLTVRVRRIQHPRTETMRPAPRTSHLISNVTIDARNPDTGETDVYSAFTLAEYRLNEQRVFAGRCRHRLRPAGESYLIVRKRVDLLNCDTGQGHVRFNVPI